LAEDIPNGCKSCGLKDALVVFLTAEKVDEKDPQKVVAKGVEEIVEVSRKLEAKNIVLFPFVHLSDNVGSTDKALKMLGEIYEKLKPLGFTVDKAPFGWEKVFSLTSKGHPLAELSRTIRP